MLNVSAPLTVTSKQVSNHMPRTCIKRIPLAPYYVLICLAIDGDTLTHLEKGQRWLLLIVPGLWVCILPARIVCLCVFYRAGLFVLV